MKRSEAVRINPLMKLFWRACAYSKLMKMGIEALRLEVMRGVADIQQGQFTTFATDGEIEAFSDEMIRQGQQGRKALETR
jgi:hypothetical protein